MTVKGMVAGIERDHVYSALDNGKRTDGRLFDELRPMSIESDVIGTANGSARVRLGETHVIAGVKLSMGQPYPDKPDQGVMSTLAELKPMASPSFDTNPVTSDSIEISRVVDRGIREGEAIDLKALCIEEGEKVWLMNLDVMVLNDQGNLIDAMSIASLSAMLGAVIPAERFGLGDDYPLPMKHYPVSVTSCAINGHIVVDPTRVEESVAGARLTITLDENGDIRAMQKGGKEALKRADIAEMIALNTKVSNKIRDLTGRRA